MFIPASHPLVDPWLSCALSGIRDPVHPMFIPASHPLVDPWLSFQHHTLWWIRGFLHIVPS
ncbi:hypothetical protein RHMOL_Rhmol02G0185800 [Rhododendron molle]|uniref:Uncharacterized protein n=1 Tax=Rhododendron molle TaxID=49168 RepID=A0ACC0PT07_RHOML|nr:hypothetical protein RHMOL_Rhmol02G0185800 [Rhododendron molle]